MTIKVSSSEDEVPIITDAVVVTDEEANVPQDTTPPAVNPNFVPPTPASTAVVTQKAPATPSTGLIVYNHLGRNPAGMHCPHCKRQMVTATQDVVGMGTLVAVFVLAIVFWPVCWLPFCAPSCQRTNHFCGHMDCRKKVGVTSVCA